MNIFFIGNEAISTWSRLSAQHTQPLAARKLVMPRETFHGNVSIIQYKTEIIGFISSEEKRDISHTSFTNPEQRVLQELKVTWNLYVNLSKIVSCTQKPYRIAKRMPEKIE